MHNITKTIYSLLYALLSFGVAYYAFNYYLELANPTNPFQAKFASSTWIAPTHFIAGGLALLLTPFQLSKKLREKSIKIHRRTGYTYVMAVFLSGTAGLLMSFNAHGGWVAKLGFFCLAIAWLSTTSLALFYAIKNNIPAHKIWIYRSISLTAAAITLRLFLGFGLGVLQLPFLTVYVPTAWLCWTINLFICELIIHQQKRAESNSN